MDPLSVISGVASVTKAAALLASSLYGIISDIRNAPREMKDMASGIRELSDVLQELRTALAKGSGLFRMKLFRSIEVTTRRIEELHEDIRGLVRLDRGMSRMVWALRSKSRAEKLLGRIDSLKLGLLLNLKTITLILERDKQKRHVLSPDLPSLLLRMCSDKEADERSGKASLAAIRIRMMAETFIACSLRCWCRPPNSRSGTPSRHRS